MLVLWTQIEAPWPAPLAAAVAAQVPAAIVARAARYRLVRDGQEILLGRLLLRAALDRTGRGGSLDQVTITAQGRPELPGAGDFSIAHADGFVACAWCEAGRVGVDVERLYAVDAADYESVFSPAERARIAAAADPSHALLRAWTLKEAITKAAGSGLSAATLPDLAGPPPVAYAGRHWHLRQRDQSGFALGLATDQTDLGAIPLMAMRLGADGRLAPQGAAETWT